MGVALTFNPKRSKLGLLNPSTPEFLAIMLELVSACRIVFPPEGVVSFTSDVTGVDFLLGGEIWMRAGGGGGGGAGGRDGGGGGGGGGTGRVRCCLEASTCFLLVECDLVEAAWRPHFSNCISF